MHALLVYAAVECRFSFILLLFLFIIGNCPLYGDQISIPLTNNSRNIAICCCYVGVDRYTRDYNCL